MNNFLPIGSVVISKDNNSCPLMIIGYYPLEINTEELYDYLTVIYPQGLISSTSAVLLNNDDITKILYKGFCDEETEEMLSKIGEISKQDIDDEE